MKDFNITSNESKEISINRILNEPYRSNCFVVGSIDSKSAIIIDPGEFEAEKIISYIIQKNFTPDYIILTHEHIDHVLGINKIKDMFDCKIIASKASSEKIQSSVGNLSKYFGTAEFTAYPADILVEDINHTLFWQGKTITFVNTPGHSPGSICIHIDNALFTGDTLIKGIKTYTKLPGGNKELALNSIEFIFNNFSPDTKVYPGHGNSFNLGEVIDNSFYKLL